MKSKIKQLDFRGRKHFFEGRRHRLFLLNRIRYVWMNQTSYEIGIAA